MKTTTSRPMTRAFLSKLTPYRMPEGARVVLGPIFVRMVPRGEYLYTLEYSTKGIGCTVAMLHTRDESAMQAAIDKWIVSVNRVRAEHAARMAAA